MDIDPRLINFPQPALFQLEDATVEGMELFPAVWNAANALSIPDVEIRRRAIDDLTQLGAANFFPLIAYLLTTLLDERDLELRARVVDTLADLIKPEPGSQTALETVRRVVLDQLKRMRTRQVFALLEVAQHQPELEAAVTTLLSACSYAGLQLANILSNRNAPLEIRKQAAYYIGRVGYLAALPVVERLAERLETRLNGQQAMYFAEAREEKEAELLPYLINAIHLLKAP